MDSQLPTIGQVREAMLNQPASLSNVLKVSAFPLILFAMVVVILILVIKVYQLEKLEHRNETMCNRLMRFGNPLQEADNLGQARVDQASMGGPVQIYC